MAVPHNPHHAGGGSAGTRIYIIHPIESSIRGPGLLRISLTKNVIL
jgi:hypothetical protein